MISLEKNYHYIEKKQQEQILEDWCPINKQEVERWLRFEQGK